MVEPHTPDAPAGTLLAVEPHVRREAVATEPDTAVLALGMARVRGAVDRPDDALAIAEAGLRELGETPGTL